MEQVYLGLGSNVGDRLANMQKAVDELKSLGSIFAASSVFECDPVYNLSMPRFFNAIVVIETGIGAHELLSKIREIEKKIGRTEDQAGKEAARTIDIDILFYGSEMIEAPPDLVVPHPLMLERLFVLMPLDELNPGIELNGKKVKVIVKKLLKANPDYKIEKTEFILKY